MIRKVPAHEADGEDDDAAEPKSKVVLVRSPGWHRQTLPSIRRGFLVSPSPKDRTDNVPHNGADCDEGEGDANRVGRLIV
jgi:hypothetical protein